MRRLSPLSVSLAAAFLTLTACEAQQAPEAEDSASADTMPAQAGVQRETMTSPEEEVTASTTVANAIQTQPGPLGVNFALERVRVTGDVMTIQLRTSAPLVECCRSEVIDLDEVSVIDHATAQQISILKDNSGKYLAAPILAPTDDKIRAELDKTAVIWFKFPAPPATSKTVSINIPGIAPFDGVPVER